ncbi:hypothetical protein IAT38_000630 [Cryptococcus sp. DSM 104549]
MAESSTNTNDTTTNTNTSGSTSRPSLKVTTSYSNYCSRPTCDRYKAGSTSECSSDTPVDQDPQDISHQ